MKNLWLACIFGLLGFGCAGGLRTQPVATAANPPGNVAVYLSVESKSGSAAGLSADNFRISEDGQDLTPAQTQQTLLPPDSVAVHRALLLVDLSGPVTEGDMRQRIATAAARFVTKAHKTQPVSVYAFDGGTAIRQVGDFPQGEDEIADVPGIASYTPQDSSSNLNAGVVDALAQLDAKLLSAHKPIRLGSLVVFTRGPDLAGRVDEHKMGEAVSDSKYRVYSISIKDVPASRSSKLNKDGVFEAISLSALDGAFDEAGTRVAEVVGNDYLLSYCSPARAGKRRLRVRVVSTDEKGKELRGDVSTDFDASGFGSGCNPSTTPRFAGESLADAPDKKDEDKDKDKDDKKSKMPKVKDSKPAPKAAPSKAAPAPAKPAESEEAVPPPAKPGYAQ